MKKDIKFLNHNFTRSTFSGSLMFITSILILLSTLEVIKLNSLPNKIFLALLILATGIIQFTSLTPLRPYVSWDRKRIEFSIRGIWKKPVDFKFLNITSFEIKNNTLNIEENFNELTTFNVENIDYNSREKILEILRENTFKNLKV